jgi:hypothetical protein
MEEKKLPARLCQQAGAMMASLSYCFQMLKVTALLSPLNQVGDVIPFSSFRTIENVKKNPNYTTMLIVYIITGNTAGRKRQETLLKKSTKDIP